jgi:hypothetical protein
MLSKCLGNKSLNLILKVALGELWFVLKQAPFRLVRPGTVGDVGTPVSVVSFIHWHRFTSNANLVSLVDKDFEQVICVDFLDTRNIRADVELASISNQKTWMHFRLEH